MYFFTKEVHAQAHLFIARVPDAGFHIFYPPWWVQPPNGVHPKVAHVEDTNLLVVVVLDPAGVVDDLDNDPQARKLGNFTPLISD